MILLFEIISDEGIFTTTKSVLNKKGNFILKKPNRHIEDDIEVNIAKIEDEDEFKVKSAAIPTIFHNITSNATFSQSVSLSIRYQIYDANSCLYVFFLNDLLFLRRCFIIIKQLYL